MTTPVSLVKVGNSNAIIIPAKILRQMNIKENTQFELTLEEDQTLQIRTVQSADKLVFPKVDVPEITEQEMNDFLDDLVTIDCQEIEKDERLAYILSR